jgi:hypothetical protein
MRIQRNRGGEAQEKEGGEGRAHHFGLVWQAGLKGNDRKVWRQDGTLQRKWSVTITPPQVSCFLESYRSSAPTFDEFCVDEMGKQKRRGGVRG